MSIAKSAPSATPVKLEPNTPSVGFNSFQYDGVDLSLYNLFGIDIQHAEETEKGRLREISEWISSDLQEKSIGNIMSEIRKVEMKLGATPYGEKKLNRIWNYLKVSQKIKDLDLQRKALER